MNGFLNVLKPVGATASDVVVCVKHLLREKVGHLGTLDPGASGVLPLAVGQATRLFAFLTDKTKWYRAFFTFGKTTDTLDAYGTVTDTCDFVPSAEQFNSVIKQFAGQQQQIPPMYSAISVGGVRSYKLARQGSEVELKPRSVTVYSMETVSQMQRDTFVVDIKCSGGSYIRSLARDIAFACGTVGYMSGLIRLASGCFNLSDAHTLDEIRQNPDKWLLDITYPLGDVECLFVEDRYFAALDNGVRIPVGNFEGYRKIYCKGKFFGLGRCLNGNLKLEYCLKNL